MPQQVEPDIRTAAQWRCLFTACAVLHAWLLAGLRAQPFGGAPTLALLESVARWSLVILEVTLIYDNVLIAAGDHLQRANNQLFGASSRLRFVFHGGLLPVGVFPVCYIGLRTMTAYPMAVFIGTVLCSCIALAAMAKGFLHGISTPIVRTDKYEVYRMTSQLPGGKVDIALIIPAVLLTLFSLLVGIAVICAGGEGGVSLVVGSVLMLGLAGAPGAAGFRLGNIGEVIYLAGIIYAL